MVSVYPNNSITGPISLIQYTNTLVDGWLGPAMLLILGFVAFITTKNYSTDRALGFASFLTLIAAIFLRFLEMINDAVLFIVIVVFIVALILLIKERSSETVGV